ncbi:MAG: hypothetical protein QM669_01555 [Siphonobacter sp.]
MKLVIRFFVPLCFTLILSYCYVYASTYQEAVHHCFIKSINYTVHKALIGYNAAHKKNKNTDIDITLNKEEEEERVSFEKGIEVGYYVLKADLLNTCTHLYSRLKNNVLVSRNKLYFLTNRYIVFRMIRI